MIDAAATGLGLNEQQFNQASVIKAQSHFVQENEKMRERRPVESSEEGAKPKLKADEETHTKTIIDEDNVIVVERYDEDGKLINKIPPGYVPLSERI